MTTLISITIAGPELLPNHQTVDLAPRESVILSWAGGVSITLTVDDAPPIAPGLTRVDVIQTGPEIAR